MRLEDNMMPVLTGLVFAVVLGSTVQYSESLMKAFGAANHIEASDDVFVVRAGTKATLDVLANDGVKEMASETDLRIVAAPACGEVVPSAGGITYLNSDSCEGPVHFKYCLKQDGACDAAEVTMRVRPAPLAIVDGHRAETGDLVPLPLPNQARNTRLSVGPSGADQPAAVTAFVVSLAPPITAPMSRKNETTRYLINAAISDLKKIPVNDPAQHVSLHLADVPLSALRAARFLKGYKADGRIAPALRQSPVEMESAKAPKDAIELNDETVRIDLKAPAFADDLDQS